MCVLRGSAGVFTKRHWETGLKLLLKGAPPRPPAAPPVWNRNSFCSNQKTADHAVHMSVLVSDVFILLEFQEN